MKKILTNKKNAVIISVILAALILVSAIVVVSQRNDGPDVDVDVSTTLEGTPGTTGTAGDGTTTEEVTEESSETSDKTQEEDKNSTTDTTTGKNDKETTTKKPNKTETTTKKPVTTTKPSKPETTTKASEKVTENAADLSQGELLAIWRQVGCETEAEYKAYLASVPNYKCKYCGDHNCPSIEYYKNRIGDTVVGIIDEHKCPAIKAEKVKCDVCGKILVDVGDNRFYNQPDKYCDGWCDFGFN